MSEHSSKGVFNPSRISLRVLGLDIKYEVSFMEFHSSSETSTQFPELDVISVGSPIDVLARMLNKLRRAFDALIVFISYLQITVLLYYMLYIFAIIWSCYRYKNKKNNA